MAAKEVKFSTSARDKLLTGALRAGYMDYGFEGEAMGQDDDLLRKADPNPNRKGAELLRYDHMDMVSGAGHDAVYVSRVAPTGMIFVPCEDGLSHNEAENASKEDIAAGANVLLHAMMERAS